MNVEAPAEAKAVGSQRSRLANQILDRSQAESWLDLLFVPVLLIGLVVWLSLTTSGFLGTQNITNIFLQASILALVAFGMTFVILAAELDLSVGAGVALVSVVVALVSRDSGSVALGILAGLGTGALLGLVNGLLVAKLEIPAFIATLATLVICGGIALRLTNGAVVGQLPSGIGALATDSFLGIKLLIWLTVIVFVVLVLVQVRTVFGVSLMSVGGNPEAARLSGLSVARIRLLAFVIVGLTVGIAGVALTSRVQSGQPNAGELLALTSIGAVVIGGTSLSGGKGSVARTLGGVLLIAVLENGLDVKGVQTDAQQVVIGAVFIGAASVDFVRRSVQARRDEAKLAAERRAAEQSVRAGAVDVSNL